MTNSKNTVHNEEMLACTSRRDFLLNSAAFSAALASGLTVFPQPSFAADDDHHFLFIELRGGVHWMIATDGRDIPTITAGDPKTFYPLKIQPNLSSEEFNIIKSASDAGGNNFAILPYLTDLQSSVMAGKTNRGVPFRLGISGMPLANLVNDIAVVRGVKMGGTFHGINNANGEMFSGSADGSMPHVASVIASILSAKNGRKFMDNLVFEKATYVYPSDIKGAMSPVNMDGEFLGNLVRNMNDAGSSSNSADRFAHAKALMSAVSDQPKVSAIHRLAFQTYIDSMTEAEKLKGMLAPIANQLKSQDASLDLDLQFSTALTLFESGLSRVITLCLGASNGKNAVDGFGLFDCHKGLYHKFIGGGTENSSLSYVNIERAMNSLAKIISTLKSKKHRSGKSWFDVTTVVVSSEFGRPSNLSGNEASGAGDQTGFGCGHLNANNNYILFGKGINPGTWIGSNHPLSQRAFSVDLASLDNRDPLKISYAGDDSATATARPLQSGDIIRTLLETVKGGAQFAEIYKSGNLPSSKVLRSIIT